MDAGIQVGCPKITFDRISGHFKSIAHITFYFGIPCLGGWMGGGGVPNSVFNKKNRAYS